MPITVVCLCITLIATLGACKSVGHINGNKSNSNSLNTTATSDPKDVNSNALKDQLRFTTSVSMSEWRTDGVGTLGSINLHITNSSDRDIEVRGRGAIHLHNVDTKEERDRFYSSSALPGAPATSAIGGAEQIHRRWIKCGKHGDLDQEINPRSIKWGREIGAEGPNRDFTEVVPPGNYDLFFTFTVGESENSGIGDGIIFESNRVKIVIK